MSALDLVLPLGGLFGGEGYTSGVPAMGAALHKLFAVGFVFVGLAVTVYRSVDDPRGLLRRLAGGYVAKIDAQQRWMFVAPTGVAIAWAQGATIAVLLVMYSVVPSSLLLAAATLVGIAPPVVLSRRVARRRAQIDEQAHGFALALSNALKATASIGDALKGAADVTAKPLEDELGIVLRQMRVGSTLEEALLTLSARVQSSALDIVVSALLIGRQTGGDLPRILEGTSASLRELKRLEEYTDKVTRSAKQSLLVSAATALLLVPVMLRIFPSFLDPLLTTWKGQMYAAHLLALYLFALYLGYRFTRKTI